MKYKMLVSAMILALAAGPSFGENRISDVENGKRQVAEIQTAGLKKEKSDNLHKVEEILEMNQEGRKYYD